VKQTAQHNVAHLGDCIMHKWVNFSARGPVFNKKNWIY